MNVSRSQQTGTMPTYYSNDAFMVLERLVDTVPIVPREGGAELVTANTSSTCTDQAEVASAVHAIYESVLSTGEFPGLDVARHRRWAVGLLSDPLPHYFAVLGASNPWIVFWLLNLAALLGTDVLAYAKQCADKIRAYRSPSGGIGGGVGQLGHAAATYAAVLVLALTGNVLECVQMRDELYDWFLELKQADGLFVMHTGGEADTRAVYCVLVVLTLLDIVTPELVAGTAEWLGRCQTYEGGFGGVPFDEAHGGYTFCALASLCLLDKPVAAAQHIDVGALTRWIGLQQGASEGGLAGRTNKLVDGCYTHWVGTSAVLTGCLAGTTTDRVIDTAALRQYVLCCCQGERGGLLDKPGALPDFYHTNYVLCGLSATGHEYTYTENTEGPAFGFSCAATPSDELLPPIDPVFGLPMGVAERFRHTVAASK